MSARCRAAQSSDFSVVISIRQLLGAKARAGIGRFAVYWLALSTVLVAVGAIVLPQISLMQKPSFDVGRIGIVRLPMSSTAKDPILADVEETPPKEASEPELPSTEPPRTQHPTQREAPPPRDRPSRPRLAAPRIASIDPVSAPRLSPDVTPMLVPRWRPPPSPEPKTSAPDLAFQGVSGPRANEIDLPPVSASLALPKIDPSYSDESAGFDFGASEVLLPDKAVEAASVTGARGGEANQQKIRGVSLASFSDCITDAQEDSLKEKLLASVQVQMECNSRAGTFHFVETKNLNAFLMRIEKNPDRRSVNRCGELELAIDCLTHARREGRES